MSEARPRQAEHGSVRLEYTPQNLCHYCKGGPPAFTWNEGEYSSWNGGARICLLCAEAEVANRIVDAKRSVATWGQYDDKYAAEEMKTIALFEKDANYVLDLERKP